MDSTTNRSATAQRQQQRQPDRGFDQVGKSIDGLLDREQPTQYAQERRFWELAVCGSNPLQSPKNRAEHADALLAEWRTRWAK